MSPRPQTPPSRGFSTTSESQLLPNTTRNMATSSSTSADRRESISYVDSVKAIVSYSKLNFLLLAFPLGLLSTRLDWGVNASFFINFLAIVPLANLLGMATEELSLVTSQTIGGLLNATFGNLVEVIVAIVALKNGDLEVVRSSLLGSMLSNLLFVLGLCFLLGGIRYPVQKFNMTAATTSSSMLTLSAATIVLPAAFAHLKIDDPSDMKDLLNISRAASILLLISYLFYLVFQLKTHTYLYQDEVDEDGEEEESKLNIVTAAILLAAASILVSISVDAVVGSIEDLSSTWGVSNTFVALILLPIAGNAPEHATAVYAALQNKPSLSLGVAMGSAVQINLLVIPVSVIAGWILNQDMTLHFPIFETAVLFISVNVVNGIVNDGKSNWLEGMLLLVLYGIIAICFAMIGESTLV